MPIITINGFETWYTLNCDTCHCKANDGKRKNEFDSDFEGEFNGDVGFEYKFDRDSNLIKYG